MQQFLDLLSNTPWLNVLFLFLTTLSILLSVFLYFRGKKEKRPVYNVRSISLVGGHLQKLERVKILYDNEEIETLTLTRFAVWNKGRETINEQDVAPTDPLRLEIDENGEILEAQISYQTSSANNFSVVVDDTRKIAALHFDYFHFNEGCIVLLYHNTTSEKLRLRGTVKGVKSLKKGIVEENAFVYGFLDRTAGKIFPPERRKRIHSRFLKGLIILIISPLFPFVFLLSAIESSVRLFQRTPKVFNLESDD